MSLEIRRLRMWIRMFRTTRAVELRMREFLRDNYDTTLPRFDVLAVLYRVDEGLKMSALSNQLLVSNGNVTGIVARLVSEGLVKRTVVEDDRRSTLVRLSAKGRELFSRMAKKHTALIDDLFSDMDEGDLDVLDDIFARLKQKEVDHDQVG